MKDKEDWKFGLGNLLSLGKDDVGVTDQEDGLAYDDYLKILLYLLTTDTLVARGMDMMEHTIICKYEESGFRVDQCVSRIHMNINTEVGMGYTYEFPIQFAYR